MTSDKPARGSARRSKRALRQADAPRAAADTGTLVKSTFKPLTDTETVQIHCASLELLSTVGLANATPEVIEVAVARGCVLNADNRLCFPASLVEDTIARWRDSASSRRSRDAATESSRFI